MGPISEPGWLPPPGQIPAEATSPAAVPAPLVAGVSGPKMVRAWRGKIRQQLRAFVRHIDALNMWNNRQNTDFPLFTGAEFNQLIAVRSIAISKLNAFRPR